MLIHSNCYSLATWFHLPCKCDPARSRSHAIAKRNWPCGACANHCSLPMACKATAGASPLFEYLLLHREDSILSIKPQPQSTIHFTICEVGEEFRPEGQRSFHPDQVLKQIGSCQLRTDNASHVARTGPDRILSFVGVPGIRPRCLVLECARSAEAASKR